MNKFGKIVFFIISLILLIPPFFVAYINFVVLFAFAILLGSGFRGTLLEHLSFLLINSPLLFILCVAPIVVMIIYVVIFISLLIKFMKRKAFAEVSQIYCLFVVVVTTFGDVYLHLVGESDKFLDGIILCGLPHVFSLLLIIWLNKRLLLKLEN